mmetsp:Transcript_14373/g.32618  ORF Transcript_14373/g.32618 Transcript_14373/m.32618 type:complete len:86 (+) Transcript_14373:305-562(+)
MVASALLYLRGCCHAEMQWTGLTTTRNWSDRWTQRDKFPATGFLRDCCAARWGTKSHSLIAPSPHAGKTEKRGDDGGLPAPELLP